METENNNIFEIHTDETPDLHEHYNLDVDKGQSLLRIDKYIQMKIENATRSKIQDSIKAGKVLVNKKAVKSNYKVKPSDNIQIFFENPPREVEIIPQDLPLDILYEDEDIIVVNKAAGMVVHPAHSNYDGTLLNALTYHLSKDDLENPITPFLISLLSTVATFKLLEYETDLENNIESLYKDLQKNGLENILCNQYYEIPKKLEINNKKEDDKIHFFSSAITHHKLDEEEIKLHFRKVINADINFHIISALWIEKIGQYIDEKFDDNIYGSRLVRIKPINTDSCEFSLNSKPYNLDSPRIFESYQHKYQSWRNNSFNTIRELHKTSSVIVEW